MDVGILLWLQIGPFSGKPLQIRSLATKVTKPTFFPYGDADFRGIREGGQFYVDNTRFIARLEEFGKNLLFLRPPRFGKSLFVQMLSAYYDVNTSKAEFRRWFRGLDAHKYAQTAQGKKMARQYHILLLDFSLDTTDPDPIALQRTLYNHINRQTRAAASKYGLDVLVERDDAMGSLENLALAVEAKGGKLYILVDEYDRFANKLMVDNPDVYNRIVAGEWGQALSSPIRAFFETLKKITTSGGHRTFTTGLMPLALADASGANNLNNISHAEPFAEMCGFKKSDLKRALGEIGLDEKEKERALDLMQRFYNGYHFWGSTEGLYNPTLSLFFLHQIVYRRHLLKDKNVDIHELMDENVKASEAFAALLQRTPQGMSALTEVRLGVPVKPLMARSFRLQQLLAPSKEEFGMAREHALMVMFHQGIVTLDSSGHFVLPNKVAKENLLGQLPATTLKVYDVEQAIANPTAERVLNLMERALEQTDVTLLCDNNFHEVGVHSTVGTALAVMCHQEGIPHQQVSEGKVKKTFKFYPLVRGDGYFDLLLSVEKRGLLFEFKRILPKQLKFGKQELDKGKYTETRFIADKIQEHLLSKSEKELRRMELNDSKKVEDVLKEATTQVRQYVDNAKKEYDLESLHPFVVLSLATRVVVVDANEME